MLVGIPLTEEVCAAVDDDQSTLDRLLERLAEVATPVAPTSSDSGRCPVVRPVETTSVGLGSDLRTHLECLVRRTLEQPSAVTAGTWSAGWHGLSGCRRLHRRYERKAEHFLAFADIAVVRICYRRLTA